MTGQTDSAQLRAAGPDRHTQNSPFCTGQPMDTEINRTNQIGGYARVLSDSVYR